MIVDVHTFQRGVDTYSDKSLLTGFQGAYCTSSVNRSFRGTINKPRPPFIYMTGQFVDAETETAFKTNAVSGVFAYKKTKKATIPHLICAAGPYILKGRVYSNFIKWSILYHGISQQWEQSHFCQAENILVWQNGKDEPLYWDGQMPLMDTCESALALLPSIVENKTKMPIGNIMTYAHGRIFVATEDNLVFASNHVYSAGPATTLGVLNFSESTYPSSGDGFGTPADLDEVTGMEVIPQHPQTNGHGPVIVFCRGGAYAIGAQISRADGQWLTDANMQTVVLTGRGCVASKSPVKVNGDIWYRCQDGSIASFRKAATDVVNEWSDTSLSREVSKYLSYDVGVNSYLSNSLFFDNRLLVSVAHQKVAGNNGQTHRWGNGLVVADFDRGSTVLRDDPLSWDGVWTGPRTTGCCKLYTDGLDRAFFFSYDTDGENRVYELSTRDGDDVSPDGSKKQEWFYITPYKWGEKEAFSIKEIDSVVTFFDNISQGSEIEAWYRPDYVSCFYPMIARDGQTPINCHTYEKACDMIFSGNLYGRKQFTADCNNASPIGGVENSKRGMIFDIMIKGRGAVNIRQCLIIALSNEKVNASKAMSDFTCASSDLPAGCCNEADQIFTYNLK